MSLIRYFCMKCGTCCYEIVNKSGTKRIPLYPDEVDQLIRIAKKRGIDFKVIEDLVFPDIKNKKILVVTYKICLDNSKKRCPFYGDIKGCTIHENKPLACQAYPLALKRIDAFNFQISIDPLCNFVIKNYENIKKANLIELKKIFEEEYPKAENFYRKNKKLQLKIKKMELKKKIEIPREIILGDFNKYLKEWDRIEIKVK